MKRLPIGIQDFRKLRREDYIYVDKTSYIYQLASEWTPFFMSRPRRFGKSLTISTLKYLFLGEKDLFLGTWIEDQWDWKSWPVIHFSMTDVASDSPELLKEGILLQLNLIAQSYGITLKQIHYKYALMELFYELSREGEIVLLIDEYDKPLLDHLHEPKKACQIREILRSFYSTIKDLDPYLRFVFITGITKFTKAGLFSTLNHLDDISLDEPYATMLGYTQQELELFFNEFIEEGQKELQQERAAFLRDVQRYYNGFSFDGQSFVYNPFSILGFFKNYRYRNYWFESGSPFFLGEYVKQHQIEIDWILDRTITESVFSAYEIEEAPPESFLVQSGYLTFKKYDQELGYSLGFPNQEVKDAFSQLILLKTYELDGAQTNNIRRAIIEGLREKDFKKVFLQMQRTFSNIPYTIYQRRERKGESIAFNILVILLTLLWGCGIHAQAEEMASLGRSDLVFFYRDDAYIVELKKAPPKKAIAQIKEKGYGEKYKGLNLFYVGIAIDEERRNLKSYCLES